MIFCRCLHCNARQNLTIDQLRIHRGLIFCSICKQRFDALATLSEADEDENIETPSTLTIPDIKEKIERPRFWLLLNCVSLAVLILQIVYFEGGSLLKNPIIYQTFNWSSHQLGYSMQYYSDLNELTVINSDLQHKNGYEWLLSAVINNESDFSQALPKFKLMLLDLNGQVVAERIFSGSEYSPTDNLKAKTASPISLAVILPVKSGDFGGYRISLL
jgi:hypothetical protein